MILVSLAGVLTFAATALANNIVGSNGRDRLRGTAGPDVINGLGGHDVINGLAGDDILTGDTGPDEINGGALNPSGNWYNFSIAGVWGWTKGPYGRGGAKALVYDESKIDKSTPLPNGMVWNMVYDPDAPAGTVAPISSEEIWQRLEWFLSQILPVAEESGVRLALHPDDPPTDQLRGGARLVNRPDKYERMLDLVPSPASALEFCLGSLAEMPEGDGGGDVYEATERFARAGRIAYVHFRNVRGKVPHYQEVFVDEGDLDMIRVLSILRDVHFDGVIIPDHTPHIECDAPWHAGMAYALGYMRAALRMIEAE